MKFLFKAFFSVLILFCMASADKNSFEPVSKKNSIGAFLELADFDRGSGKIKYYLDGRKYEADVELSNKFGIYNSSIITPHIHSYSKYSYQYANIRYFDKNLNEGYGLMEKNSIDSCDVKGHSDNHRISLEWGAEFRLSLVNSFWNGKPLYDVLMVLNGGFITGYNFLANSAYRGSFILGYDYGLSFRFEMFDYVYIASGFDWYHNYSRSFRKHGGKEKNNSMMIDFTQSGRMLVNVGWMF